MWKFWLSLIQMLDRVGDSSGSASSGGGGAETRPCCELFSLVGRARHPELYNGMYKWFNV